MEKYRHKKTGNIITKYGNKYTYSTEYVIPAWIVENSNEWELVEEMWELKIKENKDLYFKNTITGVEFHVGDEVTIKSFNTNFGDGVRNHVISGFNILGWGCISKSFFKNTIRVSFEGYDSNDRTLTLDEIIKI